MFISKKGILKPIIESHDGIHLTAYLVNRGLEHELTSQLRDVLNQAYEWLTPAMGIDERNRFLEPLDSLLENPQIFLQMKGNVGIFRNREHFRIINIPVPVTTTCQVASTFHVKPLLRWLQSDQEFLLLGIEQDKAHLYMGNQEILKYVDAFSIANSPPESHTFELSEPHIHNIASLNEWLHTLTRREKPKLFFAGPPLVIDRIKKNLSYPSLVKMPLSDSFEKENVSELGAIMRKLLHLESQKRIDRALLEFRLAEQSGRTRKNLFQVAKAVVRGQVRKLIVSDEIHIFGKLDRKSGGLALHPFDMDHEDDDVLDDLAQLVLTQGGEVVIAPRDEIPKGRPILAILEDPEGSGDWEELAKLPPEDESQEIWA